MGAGSRATERQTLGSGAPRVGLFTQRASKRVKTFTTLLRAPVRAVLVIRVVVESSAA